MKEHHFSPHTTTNLRHRELLLTFANDEPTTKPCLAVLSDVQTRLMHSTLMSSVFRPSKQGEILMPSLSTASHGEDGNNYSCNLERWGGKGRRHKVPSKAPLNRPGQGRGGHGMTAPPHTARHKDPSFANMTGKESGTWRCSGGTKEKQRSVVWHDEGGSWASRLVVKRSRRGRDGPQ